MSEWRAEEIAAALRVAGELGLDRIVSNQPQYNMLWRVIEAEVVPLCEKEGIGQIVFSPIAQGVLTGKYQPGAAPPADSRATDPSGSRFIKRLLTDETLTAVQRLKPLADEAGLSMAQLAVAWTLQNQNVSAAIVGATRPAPPARPRGPSLAQLLPSSCSGLAQSSGCRLIGPYSVLVSSSSET